MRKLIAWAFMYSLDGLLADEGTEYWQYCFGLPADPATLQQKIDVYRSAYAHIMGRVSYEAMAGALADHPFTGIMNAAPSSVAYSSTNPELRRAHRRGAARGRRGSAVPTMRRPRQAGPPKAFPAPFRIAQSMIRALTTTELRLSLTTLEEHRARAGDEVVVRLGGWRSVGRRVPL